MAGGGSSGALRFVPHLHGELPAWSTRLRTAGARAGTVRVKALAAGGAVAALCAAQGPQCDLVAGWSQQGAARAYEASNLFEYMDGNAEGYLLYGFAAMHGVTCVHGGDSILIDISEFADGDSAYGMFSANRDPRLPAETPSANSEMSIRMESPP